MASMCAILCLQIFTSTTVHRGHALALPSSLSTTSRQQPLRAARGVTVASKADDEERFRLDNLGPQPGARRRKQRVGRGYGAGQVSPSLCSLFSRSRGTWPGWMRAAGRPGQSLYALAIKSVAAGVGGSRLLPDGNLIAVLVGVGAPFTMLRSLVDQRKSLFACCFCCPPALAFVRVDAIRHRLQKIICHAECLCLHTQALQIALCMKISP